jgi:hypothetical protein
LNQNKAGKEDFINFLAFSLSGLTGGFVGGSIAGLLTMMTLRPYAPSISWRHISLRSRYGDQMTIPGLLASIFGP